MPTTLGGSSIGDGFASLRNAQQQLYDLGFYDQYYGTNSGNGSGTSTSPTSAGSLTGTTTTQGSEASGYRPVVPDPTTSAATALYGNAVNLPNIEGVAQAINLFNQSELQNQIASLYPQFKGTVNQLGQNISEGAAGNISTSTKNLLGQAMAERGAAGGQGVSSPNTNAALMALMGKTSEGIQSQALTDYSKLLSSLPLVQGYDVTSMFTSPETQYNSQLLSNIYAASANPAAAYSQAKSDATSGLNAGLGTAGGGVTMLGGGGSGSGDFLSSLVNRSTGGAAAGGGGGGAYPSGSFGDVGNWNDQNYLDMYDWLGLSSPTSTGGGGVQYPEGSYGNLGSWTNQDYTDYFGLD